MKVIQVEPAVFKVYLNKDELEDLKHEADYSSITRLDVMKAIFLMTFVQIMSCRYWRRQLRDCKPEKPNDDDNERKLEIARGG